MRNKQRWYLYPFAAGIGLLNGLFGAGGGVLAVPLLRRLGLEENESHATSIAITLPLSVASGVFYLRHTQITLGDALPYLPGAFAGAVAGAYLLPKVPTLWLRRIFGAVIVFSALRILMR